MDRENASKPDGVSFEDAFFAGFDLDNCMDCGQAIELCPCTLSDSATALALEFGHSDIEDVLHRLEMEQLKAGILGGVGFSDSTLEAILAGQSF